MQQGLASMGQEAVPADPTSAGAYCRHIGKDIRIAFQNIQGMSTKRQELEYYIQHQRFDIFGIAETKIQTSHREVKDSGTFYFSSSHTPAPASVEHLGVGVYITKELNKYISEIRCISSRILAFVFHTYPLEHLVIICYAPHAGHAEIEHDVFYHELEAVLQSKRGAIPILLGDFNVRLGQRLDTEAEIMGTQHFPVPPGPPTAEVTAQRERFTLFLAQHWLFLVSTLHPRTLERLVTYRHPTQAVFSPPWDPQWFAQLDHVVTAQRYKNSCRNCFSLVDYVQTSDHAVLVSIWSTRLRHRKQQKLAPTPRLQVTKDEDKTSLLHFLAQEREENPRADLAQFHATLDQFLRSLPPAQHAPRAKRTHITPITLNLITQKHTALRNGNFLQARAYDTLIRRRVRQEKTQYLLTLLNNFEGPRANWAILRKLRQPFLPPNLALHDADGNTLP
eukprot:6474179-Amphidinium_carterae.1